MIQAADSHDALAANLILLLMSSETSEGL
jgi:hypothetical protein